mmetsp:Transcript_8775/g.18130  ORF Transcript_8775/g.18130 Transcript_8775/m.18130 type:complete len:1272 (-) Transcript_8775:207-4022(-)
MGHEEVETVLPPNFAPTPDPAPVVPPSPVKSVEENTPTPEAAPQSEPAPAPTPVEPEPIKKPEDDAHKSRKSSSRKERSGSRSRMMERIRGSWRTHRSRSRSRSRSRLNVDDDGSLSTAATDRDEKKKKKSGSKLIASSFRGRIPGLRKADSNATELRDNTTKAREAEKAQTEEPVDMKAEEKKEEEESVGFPQGLRPMTPVREGAASPTDTTVTATSFDTDNNKHAENSSVSESPKAAPAPVPVLDPMSISVEIGDENEQFEVPLPQNTPTIQEPPEVATTGAESPPPAPAPENEAVPLHKNSSSSSAVKLTRSRSNGSAAGSVHSTRSNKSTTSIQSNRSTKSNRSTMSSRSTKSKTGPEPTSSIISKGETKEDEPAPSEDAPLESNDNNALVLSESSETRKWTKKVSLSIGGYKTSFQFSDPMSNLAESVGDALNVVSNDALLREAKNLDNIGDKVEEERDYDVQPTKLFMFLQQRAWGLALAQLEKNPDEAAIWVYRKVGQQKAPNVKDGYKSQALVVQSQALVVHDGNNYPNKMRWKLLPLHASIVLGAPPEIIFELIKAYPQAATKVDERGSLPVHLAASRLDVDTEGEKVMLRLFGAYPDSIECKDKKGRTPPELAKLARMRKDAEMQRRKNAFKQEEVGIEKTASQYQAEESESESEQEEASKDKPVEDDDDDDNVSVKSSMSSRFRRLMTSKSSDTTDVRRKKKKKKKKKSKDVGMLKKSKSDDMDENEASTNLEEMGPGFSILRTSSYTSQRIKSEVEKCGSAESDEKSNESDSKSNISWSYKTPSEAPGSSAEASMIPLPMTFDEDDKSASSVKSSASAKSNTSSRSMRSTRSTKSSKGRKSPPQNVDEMAVGGSGEAANNLPEPQQDNIQQESQLHPETEPEPEPEPEPWNEGLRVLLEKAAENAGRSGQDVTEYLKILADEWVTDVEALRRLDSDTLDDLLPLLLSREVQRLTTLSDSIDSKFFSDESSRGRSPHKKKTKKRVPRKMRKKSIRPRQPSRSESPQDNLNTIKEEPSDDDLSIVTEAKTVCSRADSKVSFQTRPEVTTYEEADSDEDEMSEVDHELQIRKMHAKLIADARKKFPTRESLEDAIWERQAEVEAAVNSGFDVDKETLSRAALADDEVRKLLPLRLILPTADDLNEMIEVLQVHKESALRNLDMKKAAKIQSEIDELQGQINEEDNYKIRKNAPQKKLVGILKSIEEPSQGWKNAPSGFSVCSDDGEQSVADSDKTMKMKNISVPLKSVPEVDGRDDNNCADA